MFGLRAKLVLAGLVVAAGGVVVAGAADMSTGALASTSNPKYSGWAIMNHKGFGSEAKARTSELSRVRIRFDTGVLVKITASRRSQLYAGYSLTVGGESAFGNLEISPGMSSGKFLLSAVGQPGQVFRGLTATLTTGKRPSLVVSGFPAGTTKMRVSTAGPGIAATRLVAPCKNKLQRNTGSMLITLASGANEKGLVDNGLFCGPVAKPKK
jgi:hypothetical protein